MRKGSERWANFSHPTEAGLNVALSVGLWLFSRLLFGMRLDVCSNVGTVV